MSLKLATTIVCLTFALSACTREPAPDTPAAENPSIEAAPGQPAATNVPGATPPAAAPRPAAAAPVNPAPPAPPVAAPAPAAPAPVAARVRVPAGTQISVLMIDSISTASNKAGEQFLASLAEPLTVNGKVVADKGTTVQGRILDAVGAGRVQGKASMRIALISIMDGQRAIPIVTEPVVAEAEGTRGKDAAIVAGAAGIGAAIGAIAGGKKGAGIGTVVGAGSGTGAVLATRGNEVEFPSETKVNFTLQEAAELPAITRKTS